MKSCLVFQLKREEKSVQTPGYYTDIDCIGSLAERGAVERRRKKGRSIVPASKSNLIIAYSSFLLE